MKLRTFSLLMAVPSFLMIVATDGLMAAIWFAQLCAWVLVSVCIRREVP